MAQHSVTDPWYSVQEAADYLGFHPQTVRNWMSKGELAFFRSPGKRGRIRIRRSELDRFAQPVPTPADTPAIEPASQPEPIGWRRRLGIPLPPVASIIEESPL